MESKENDLLLLTTLPLQSLAVTNEESGELVEMKILTMD